jgi:hypothetical protein
LVTIRCQSRIFALVPLVYPQVVASVGKVLREHAAPRRMFTWRGARLLQYCQGQLQWTPENYVDIAEFCKEEEWSPHLDGITEKVVGGLYCRHASQFLAESRHPSQVVLKHRAMMVSLVYAFGIYHCKSSHEKLKQEKQAVRERESQRRRRPSPSRPDQGESSSRSSGGDKDRGRDRSDMRGSKSR